MERNLKLIIDMEKKKLFNSRVDLENTINDIKEDKVLKSVIEVVCKVAKKVAKYIDNFEGIMTDYDGDTACITENNNYFEDVDKMAFGAFKEYIIEACNNIEKPQYELLNIVLIDDVTILKVKV